MAENQNVVPVLPPQAPQDVAPVNKQKGKNVQVDHAQAAEAFFNRPASDFLTNIRLGCR